MSLIKCPECQREISSSATFCPHCGYPLKETDKENKIEANEEVTDKAVEYPQPLSSEWTKKWKTRAIIIKTIESLLCFPSICYIIVIFILEFVNNEIMSTPFFKSVFIFIPIMAISFVMLFCTHCLVREVDGYNVVGYSFLTHKLIIEDKVCQSKVYGRYLYGKLPNGKNIKAVFSVWDGQPDIQVSDGEF